MEAETLKQQGRRAGRSEEVEWLGRAGLAAQGTIYALVALLAVQVAVDGRDAAAQPDKEGALQLVSEQPLGGWLLGALALGFAAYALWRLAQSIVDREGKGSDAKALAKRFGYFCLGAWYALLTVLTVSKLLSGSDDGGGSGGVTDEKQATSGILDLPLGRELVFGAALGFVGAAGWNVYRALSGKLEKRVRSAPTETRRTAALSLGAVGHLARGAVFGMIGVFLAKAALEYDPQEARGLDGALYELARQPYGSLLLGGVAAGLGAFALWCWAQARYRDV